jgi:hypothetical protein
MLPKHLRLVRSPKRGNRDEPKDDRWAQRGTSRLTWTSFSFACGAVTVRIKVLPGAKHISLPLRSAEILPSSYGISCHIEGEDTIVFQLTRPATVMVIAHYEQASEEPREYE